jgi:ankyrin repeat protein
LLDTQDIDVNTKEMDGCSLIFFAAARGFEDIVGLLLMGGADVDLPNEDGVTLLAIAERKGHDEVVDLLKRHLRNLRRQRINADFPKEGT